MKEWDETSEDVTRIRPDKEKAKSLLQLIALHEKNMGTMSTDEFATLIVEGYYEIVKELITAIMSTEGWKTVSHELLMGYIAKFYSGTFSQAKVYRLGVPSILLVASCTPKTLLNRRPPPEPA